MSSEICIGRHTPPTHTRSRIPSYAHILYYILCLRSPIPWVKYEYVHVLYIELVYRNRRWREFSWRSVPWFREMTIWTSTLSYRHFCSYLLQQSYNAMFQPAIAITLMKYITPKHVLSQCCRSVFNIQSFIIHNIPLRTYYLTMNLCVYHCIEKYIRYGSTSNIFI